MNYVIATEQPLICRHLTRLNINKSGYAKGGTYWGTGMPVYTFDLYWQKTNNRFHTDTAVRARTKRDAKRLIKQRFPAVKKFIED